MDGGTRSDAGVMSGESTAERTSERELVVTRWIKGPARLAFQAWTDAEAYRWQTFWTVTRLAEGKRAGAESSLVKLWWSELDVRLHELALELLGPHAELVDGDEAAWMKGYEFALAGPIYAGTNEIQRNVVAERVLGLPRR